MTTKMIVIEEINAEKAPTIYKDGGLRPFLDHIREQALSEVTDPSTAKGRDRIKSLAAQVSKSKTAVEKTGREYLKKVKELPKEIEKELREFVTACDALRDEVRKPVTEFEEKEAARIAWHESNISELTRIANEPMFAKDTCNYLLASFSDLPKDAECEEFAARYATATDLAKANLNRILEAIAQVEQSARLQAVQAAAEQKAREERIASEAKEAAERAAFERESYLKAQAEQAAKQAEIDKQLALQKAEQEKQAAIEAERLKFEALKKAEELARLEQEKLAAENSADMKHRHAVDKEVIEKLIVLGVCGEQALEIIEAASRGRLGKLTINY